MTNVQELLDHFGIPEIPGDNYLLLCDGAPVTVRSQQIRALNLLSALNRDKKLTDRSVAVIGGGAAGLMFAAGAASLGARVELFEKSYELLHLQRGCWHRPLHPEIFKWPDDTAYRNVSYLPLLGWSAGRAHDVADQILTKFKGVEEHFGAQLKVTRGHAAQLTADGHVITSFETRHFHTVVLAVGFGVETLPYDLPWNNYWRADPLDQSFLDEGPDEPHILVVGSGDGALIEILRSCVQSFEHGALLDRILNETLDAGELRKTVRDVNDATNSESGKSRFEQYCEIQSKSVARILGEHLRHCRVTWLVGEPAPFVRSSLPINRFIASQLTQLSKTHRSRDGFIDGPYCAVDVFDVERRGKKYLVKYVYKGRSKSIECDHAIIRYGAERERDSHGSTELSLLRSVTSAIADGPGKNKILIGIRERLNRMKGTHQKCHEAQWETGFFELFESAKNSIQRRCNPILHAEFIRAFHPRDPDNPSVAKLTFRIRIKTFELPEHFRLTYDLHSETGRVISRIGAGENHVQWLNTYRDYAVRARSNEGSEWNLGTVVEALKRGVSKHPVPAEGGQKPIPFDDAVARLEQNRARPREDPPTPSASPAA